MRYSLPGRDTAVNCFVTSEAKTDIKSLQLDELQEKLRELGEPSYRAGQVADWLYKKRVDAIEQMTDLPRDLRARLEESFRCEHLEVVRLLGARDTTRIFLFPLTARGWLECVHD